jgi:deoxyribonuclease V
VEWPRTREELIAEQERLGALEPPPWRFDAAARVGGVFVCGVVVGGRRSVRAGLLALREGPLFEAAVRALPEQPDALLVDATGRDHPRRAGVALHLGVVLDLPTVASLLATGCVRARGRPLAVHAAWRTDAETAAEFVLSTCRARTPEPLRHTRRQAREARAAGG